MTTSRRTVLDVMLGVLLVVAVASTFAPWIRSGEAHRSSYDVVRTVERLEIGGTLARSVGRVLWATLPLVAAVAVLALVRERRMVAAGLALWVAGVVGSVAGALTRAPQVADDGVVIAVLVAVCLAVVAVAMLLDGWRQTR